MRSVNIADLKAHLSAHIRRVREGEEIVVCERNTPRRPNHPLPGREFLGAREAPHAPAVCCVPR